MIGGRRQEKWGQTPLAQKTAHDSMSHVSTRGLTPFFLSRFPNYSCDDIFLFELPDLHGRQAHNLFKDVVIVLAKQRTRPA